MTFDLHNIRERVDGAPEVGFPDLGIRLGSVGDRVVFLCKKRKEKKAIDVKSLCREIQAIDVPIGETKFQALGLHKK